MYIILGGTSGIGKATANEITAAGIGCLTVSRDKDADCQIDFSYSLKDWAEIYSHFLRTVDHRGINGLIDCAGVNFIAPHSNLDEIALEHLLRVNALKGFWAYRMTKDYMTSGAPFCSVVSDAAWTPMTHSFAYNVSKAAQLMAVKQLAHEEKKHIIFGVAPGKVANTQMSDYIDHTFPPMRGWTYEQGREYQLKGLKTGEMEPHVVGRFIKSLIHPTNKHYHGHIFPIGG